MLSCYVWSAYVLFIILDMLSFGIVATNWIKYSIIVVLFSHSVCSFLIEHKQNKCSSQRIIITIALFFTMCADYFLLFTECFSIGILCFILVQNVYQYLIDLKIKEIKKQMDYKNFFLFGFLQVILFLLFSKWFLYITAGEYACFLFRNMFVSWHHQKKTGIIIPIAITLLFICDCNVMLANVTDYEVFWKLIWIFYVPSQFLLEKYVHV